MHPVLVLGNRLTLGWNLLEPYPANSFCRTRDGEQARVPPEIEAVH